MHNTVKPETIRLGLRTLSDIRHDPAALILLRKMVESVRTKFLPPAKDDELDAISMEIIQAYDKDPSLGALNLDYVASALRQKLLDAKMLEVPAGMKHGTRAARRQKENSHGVMKTSELNAIEYRLSAGKRQQVRDLQKKALRLIERKKQGIRKSP